MLHTILPILGLGAGVYTLRLVGMSLPDLRIPRRWERALRFVPVALLTTLILISILGRGPDEQIYRFGGTVIGALAAWRTRKMWVCIFAGMAVYLALRMFWH